MAPRQAVNSSSSNECCNVGRATPRDGRTARAVRKDACQAQLVGLVCALPERSSGWQQPGRGRCGRRSPHRRGPACSSPITRELKFARRFDTWTLPCRADLFPSPKRFFYQARSSFCDSEYLFDYVGCHIQSAFLVKNVLEPACFIAIAWI